MIRAILILSLLLPRAVFSQPVEKPNTREVLWVDGYEIAMTELLANKRFKLADTMLCMGEYDYTVVAGYIEDSVVARDAEIARVKSERDSICDTSKAAIREKRDAIESKLRFDLNLATEKLVHTSSTLEDTKAAHKSDLKHHYVVEAVLSVALLGVISVLIIK